MNGCKNSTPVKTGLVTGNEIWEHHFALQTKQGDIQFGLVKKQLEGCRLHNNEEM
jgi:hypothetical protein